MSSRIPRSAIDKLARAQDIIGYQFRDVSLLQEALGIYRDHHKRLGVLGDHVAKLVVMDRWYDIQELTPGDWSRSVSTCLSNVNLTRIGLRKGLAVCTTPDISDATRRKAMADTVEAILGAVYRDAVYQGGQREAGLDEVEAVVNRLGITSRFLISHTHRRWLLWRVSTTRQLEKHYFDGHHREFMRAMDHLSDNKQSILLPRNELGAFTGCLPLNEALLTKPEAADLVPRQPGLWERLSKLLWGDPELRRAPRGELRELLRLRSAPDLHPLDPVPVSPPAERHEEAIEEQVLPTSTQNIPKEQPRVALGEGASEVQPSDVLSKGESEEQTINDHAQDVQAVEQIDVGAPQWQDEPAQAGIDTKDILSLTFPEFISRTTNWRLPQRREVWAIWLDTQFGRLKGEPQPENRHGGTSRKIALTLGDYELWYEHGKATLEAETFDGFIRQTLQMAGQQHYRLPAKDERWVWLEETYALMQKAKPQDDDPLRIRNVRSAGLWYQLAKERLLAEESLEDFLSRTIGSLFQTRFEEKAQTWKEDWPVLLWECRLHIDAEMCKGEKFGSVMSGKSWFRRANALLRKKHKQADAAAGKEAGTSKGHDDSNDARA